jgi:hypothetical protein
MNAKTNQLSNRLLDFAVEVIKITDALPNTVAGRHVGGQLIRAGTSPAAQIMKKLVVPNPDCAQDEYCDQRTEGITVLAKVNFQD